MKNFEGNNPGPRKEFLRKSKKNRFFAKCGSRTPKLWIQTSKFWQRGFENPGLEFLVGACFRNPQRTSRILEKTESYHQEPSRIIIRNPRGSRDPRGSSEMLEKAEKEIFRNPQRTSRILEKTESYHQESSRICLPLLEQKLVDESFLGAIALQQSQYCSTIALTAPQAHRLRSPPASPESQSCWLAAA